MAIRQGAWDCPACGRVANRGPATHCPGCGRPRGDDVPLYLPDDAPEITERAALERASAGPDWTCEHCDGDNHAEDLFCGGCGAPRGASPARPVVEHRPPAPPPPPPADAAERSRRPSKARRKELKERARRQGRSGCRRTLYLALGGLGLLVALLAWCGRTDETTATVTGFAWQRTISVEALTTTLAEAQAGRLPAGARPLDDAPSGGTRAVTERVQVGTERVQVGVRDLGNGYFEDVFEDRPIYELRRRQVPVRGPPSTGRVRYEIDRWESVREPRAAGTDRAPRWPDPELEPGEREGERSETLWVHLAAPGGRSLRYRARDEAAWRRFEIGRSYRVEATAAGAVRRLTPR